MARDFHITDILSITTGKLVSNRHMDGVYDLLNYMTKDNLFTHQLGRAARECAPDLLRQHPQLARADCDGVDGDNLAERTAEWVEKYGATLPIAPLPDSRHEFVDPMSELAENVHPDRIIQVKVVS